MGCRFAAAVRYTVVFRCVGNKYKSGRETVYGSNKLSALDPAGGDSRPLERFMRIETVAKKFYATELLLSSCGIMAVVSKIRLNSVSLSVRAQQPRSRFCRVHSK